MLSIFPQVSQLSCEQQRPLEYRAAEAWARAHPTTALYVTGR